MEARATQLEPEQLAQALTNLSARLKAGEPEEQIKAQLIDAGVDERAASELLRQAARFQPKDLEKLRTRTAPPERQNHMNRMLIGLAMFGGGALVTGATYLFAGSSSSYVICYGAMAVGIVTFLSGLFRWLQTQEPD